jgi:hypothetical protein
MLMTGLRRLVWILAWIYGICVPLQVFFAGLGVFKAKVAGDLLESYRPYYGLHVNFGYLLGMLSLVILILSLLARHPSRIWRATGLLFVLNAVQSSFIYYANDTPVVGALHPVNALAIFWVSIQLIRSLTNFEMDPESGGGKVAEGAEQIGGSGRVDVK